MLRLHPSKIVMTIDEIHRVLESSHQLVPSISTTSLTSSTYWDESPLAIEDSKSHGKQRKSRHPPGPLDITTALTGLRLSTPNPSEPDIDDGYTAEDSEGATPMPINEQQRDAYFDTVRRNRLSLDQGVDGSNDEESHPRTSMASNRMEDALSSRAGSSLSDRAYSNVVSPMEYSTPPRSNSSRIAHWLDRSPRVFGRNTMQNADLNIWNNQDPSDREFRFDAGAESDASSYLADGEDNENVTGTIADPFTLNGRARAAAEDQVPNPMDTLRTALRDFQLDGANEDSDEDEEQRGMMLETPARSAANSRAPSRLDTNPPTSDLPAGRQTFGHISGFPGPSRSPLMDTAALRLSFMEPGSQDALTMGQLGNNIHRFINNAARRNRNIIPEPMTIFDDEYEGDSEDNFQSDYFDLGSERRMQLQEDAARRTIR